MTTATRTAAPVTESCCWPTREAIEENLRQAREVVETARQAAQHAVAGAELNVRRHPVQAAGAAAVVGFVIGGLLGLGAGWCARGRR